MLSNWNTKISTICLQRERGAVHISLLESLRKWEESSCIMEINGHYSLLGIGTIILQSDSTCLTGLFKFAESHLFCSGNQNVSSSKLFTPASFWDRKSNQIFIYSRILAHINTTWKRFSTMETDYHDPFKMQAK